MNMLKVSVSFLHAADGETLRLVVVVRDQYSDGVRVDDFENSIVNSSFNDMDLLCVVCYLSVGEGHVELGQVLVNEHSILCELLEFLM